MVRDGITGSPQPLPGVAGDESNGIYREDGRRGIAQVPNAYVSLTTEDTEVTEARLERLLVGSGLRLASGLVATGAQ